MTSYELHLLGLAVEACTGKGHKNLRIDPISNTASIETAGGGSITHHWKRTLAEALTALLTDLGVEVPARPSAERVEEVRAQIEKVSGPGGLDLVMDLGDLYHDADDGALVVDALLIRERERRGGDS